ncbi:cholinephosphotransferase 1 isoform X3 [Corvus hawaiiensis]|uniref:cholinephosphotransferase 1 isoform X3 n=1 Tax=Corvus hawaiiensis TaxID=134902 RepID=UPI0020185BF2|nr:cholinephosphotransferase 1 isoform X3 [Corvus hawaiiensis]
MPKCCRDHVEGRGSADELWPFTAQRAPWGRGFGVVGTWPALHAVVQRAQPGSPGAWHSRLPHGAACIPCACLCAGSWLGREWNPPQERGCHPGAVEAPFWAYILGAIGLFIYQSLDAIDGKQARRTNSSSPLGELFDHGCDSISTVFVVLGSCIAIRLGTNPDWLFFCCFVGLFMFYSAHWQTYVSGILRFGKIDVTEVQIAITMLLLISAYGGAAIWDYKVPLLGLELKFFAVIGILCGTALSFLNYFRVIFGGGVGKNGSTIAGTSVLSPGLHIGLLITLAIMIYKKSTTQLFEKHSCLYVLTFGFVNAKISQKLVVAHMTKSEICLQDSAFIGPGLLFLDQYFNSFIDEYIVLWIALVQVAPPLSHQNNMD